MRGLCRQVMGECVMKKMDKRLLVGVVPTRREAFENETTTRQKEEVMKRFRQLSKELDFDMVDIEDINEEGLLMTYRDVKAAYAKLSAAGVDALIFPHCNFGQEEAVGRLAKDMGVPVLIWGPRDGWPNGLEWRPTDAQCGMFATTKLLMHYGVKYSYIENCETDSDILKEGLADFLAAANVVKAFRALRIARISARISRFWFGSSPSVGSSITSTRGSCMIACARQTLRRNPLESDSISSPSTLSSAHFPIETSTAARNAPPERPRILPQ